MSFDFIDSATLRGIGTALVLLSFVCVTLWTYSGKRRVAFDQAALVPFADEPTLAGPRSKTL
jgi:cytochrome c oxidase cbb3-type subunit 4